MGLRNVGNIYRQQLMNGMSQHIKANKEVIIKDISRLDSYDQDCADMLATSKTRGFQIILKWLYEYANPYDAMDKDGNFDEAILKGATNVYKIIARIEAMTKHGEKRRNRPSKPINRSTHGSDSKE